MNTVLAGRANRISVPFPASSLIGAPLTGICAVGPRPTRTGSPGDAAAGAGIWEVSAGTGCAKLLLAPVRRKVTAATTNISRLCTTAPLRSIESEHHLGGLSHK